MGAVGGHPPSRWSPRSSCGKAMTSRKPHERAWRPRLPWEITKVYMANPSLGSQLECNCSFNLLVYQSHHHFEAAELEVWVCQYRSPKIALIQGTWTSHPDAIGSALAPKYQQVPGSKRSLGNIILFGWICHPSLVIGWPLLPEAKPRFRQSAGNGIPICIQHNTVALEIDRNKTGRQRGNCNAATSSIDLSTFWPLVSFLIGQPIFSCFFIDPAFEMVGFCISVDTHCFWRVLFSTISMFSYMHACV